MQELTDITTVPYAEWGPHQTEEIWERLHIPGVHGQQKIDYQKFHEKLYLNPGNRFLVSHYEELDSVRRKVRLAFAIEHFLKNFSDLEFPRILEVGACPTFDNYTPPARFKTNVALVAENPNYRVAGVDLINTWNSTYTGDGKLFVNSFLSEEVQQRIAEYLGGKPDIILGRDTLIEGLYEWRNRVNRYEKHVMYPPVSRDEEVKLVIAANNFLAEGGLLVIENIRFNPPDITHLLPLVASYRVEELNKYEIQFRQKADLGRY